MGTPRVLTVVLTVLAYVVATFGVQATSHFAINADHYRTITFLRDPPVFAFGILSMVIQGTVFALLFPAFGGGRPTLRRSLLFAWALGAFLASYIVLGESGKYAVPSVAAWIRVELLAAVAQFTLFGVLLWLVHRRSS